MKTIEIKKTKLVHLILAVFFCFLFFTSCDYISPEDYKYSEAEYMTISGVTTVTANSTRSYYTFYLENATYEWTVPEGATIKSGQGTSQISVLFGTKSGTISVNVKGMNASITVIVN